MLAAPMRVGTRVSDRMEDVNMDFGRLTIKGLATIDNVTLINVEVRAGRRLGHL